MKSYYRALFLDKRYHYDFIDKLFLELGRYWDEYVGKTGDVPYSYSERTFVGHLAQSAGRNGYYSIQDYNVNGEEIKKRFQSHYVPDLHVWMPKKTGKPETCVFEAKITYPIPIDKDPKSHLQTILTKLLRAKEQIDSQAYYEAKYRCAIVASPIHCSSTKWLKYASTSRIYHSRVNEMRTNFITLLRKSDANFVWTYMLDYDNVRKLTRKDEGNEFLPWVGIFCVGKVQRYLHKRRL